MIILPLPMRLKILTLNFWGVPILTGRIQKRLALFAKQILVNKPDIICLQEIWLLKDKKFIKDQLKGRYYVNNSGGSKKLGEIFNLNRKGGLVTLSRYKIENSKFYQFKKHDYFRIDELVGGKGFLKTQIVSPVGKFILINTHLSAGFKPNNQKIRIQQLNQLLRFAKKTKQELPLILVGDFNFKPQTPEYRLITKNFIDTGELKNLDTASKEAKLPKSSFYPVWRLFRKLSNRLLEGRVDYVFVKKKQKISVRPINSWIVFKDKNLVSDHYGYLVHLRL